MLSVLAFVAALVPVPVAAVQVAAAAGPVPAVERPAPVAMRPRQAAPSAGGFVRIAAGEHVPFYGDGEAESVPAFEIARRPVSQLEFLEFVKRDPRWRRGAVKRVYADAGYLRSWAGPLSPEDPAAPVVEVSWFAARAYCASIGARLPTTTEWEFVAAASESERSALHDASFRARVLESFTAPRPDRLPAAGSGAANWYGVRDLHGFVREWVSDFNSVTVADDSRAAGGRDAQLYCAAAASGARDVSDYAAFLRYSFRASLGPRSTQSNLGFRCARSAS